MKISMAQFIAQIIAYVVVFIIMFATISFIVLRHDSDKTEEVDMVTEPRIELISGVIPQTTKRPYFAYGTLTNANTMRSMAANAEFVGVAELYGFKHSAWLRIKPDAQGVVTGALWLISQTDEARLDQYEHVPSLYEKIEVDGILVYK